MPSEVASSASGVGSCIQKLLDRSTVTTPSAPATSWPLKGERWAAPWISWIWATTSSWALAAGTAASQTNRPTAAARSRTVRNSEAMLSPSVSEANGTRPARHGPSKRPGTRRRTCLLSGGSQQEQLTVLHGHGRADRRGRGRVGLDVREPGVGAEQPGGVDDPAGLPDPRADRDAVAAGWVELGDAGRRGGIDPDRPRRALDQVEAPDRAVAALGRHHGPALGGAVLVDHQVLAAHVQVVGADGDVATGGDHGVGVVDDREGGRLEGVARMQPQRIQPPELIDALVGAAGGAGGVEEELVAVGGVEGAVLGTHKGHRPGGVAGRLQLDIGEGLDVGDRDPLASYRAAGEGPFA